MQTKTFSAANVKIKNAATGEFEAVFATLGVIDKDGDVIEKGAIDDGRQVVISAYGHSVWEGERPVGTGTIHEINDELVVKGRYFLDVPTAADDFNTVKALAEESQGEWSFGLMDVKSERGKLGDESANFLKAITVPEVSPVFIGAGVNTRTTMTKGADMKFSEHINTVLTEVDVLIDRAEEVVTLRAAKGKTIGADSAELLTKVQASMDRLKTLVETSEQSHSDEDDAANEAAANELVRSLQLVGVTQ